MNINEYINTKKELYNHLLVFFDEESDDFQLLVNHIELQNIQNNKDEFQSFLYLISKLSKNYHRYPGFLEKIERIILHYQNDILHCFSNIEIFNIFKTNKRILLFLFKNSIVKMEPKIKCYLTSKKELNGLDWTFYFAPEIKRTRNSHYFNPFMNYKCRFLKEFHEFNPQDIENYEEKRLLGQNDSYICQLIREDSVDEFIIYVNRTNLPLNSTIVPSIYETNPLLLKKNPTLIEYAVFFGSIQIFNYLRFNNVELTPSLWIYAIHSKNSELIYILEENEVDFKNQKILGESIKCHHNDIANYFIENLLDESSINNDIKSNFNDNLFSYSFHYSNYQFLPITYDKQNKFIFSYICKYNYFQLFQLLKNSIPIQMKFIAIHLAELKNDSRILNILISDSEYLIRSNTFRNCSTITDLSIPYGIKKIESYSFDHCSMLSQIALPSSIIEIESNAFDFCKSLKKIIMPPLITKINDSTFRFCRSLYEIIIPPSVIEIGKNAFFHCEHLQKITIPSSLQKINKLAFYFCHSLTSIDFPSTLKLVDDYAFQGCYSLTDVIFKNPNTIIGTSCFEGCCELKYIKLPSSLEKINDKTFSKCFKLVNIEIPDSVESIGDYAFYGCLELRTVKINNTSKLNKIDHFAFQMCEKLIEINIPSSVTKNPFSPDSDNFYYSSSDEYYSDDDDCQNSADSILPISLNNEYKVKNSSNNSKKDKCNIY